MELNIVVFIMALMSSGALCRGGWSISMPANIVAVPGSCVLIPCRFKIPEEFNSELLNSTPVAIWRRTNTEGPYIFDSAQTPTRGVLVGDLLEKNCSTIFNSSPGFNDTYFFRLECPNRLKFTFSAGVSISWTDGAPSPKLHPQGVSVLEGGGVQLTCSAPAPCPSSPPTLSWSATGREESRPVTAKDGLVMMTSTLTFNASSRQSTVTCSARYPAQPGGAVQMTQSSLSLRVLYTPKNTLVLPSLLGPVPEGTVVTLACQSDANPPVERYTWYSHAHGHSERNASQPARLGDGQTLMVLGSRQWHKLYQCEAHSRIGSQRSEFIAVELETAQQCSMQGPYILCGVMVALYLLTLAVFSFSYQSLSRRLTTEQSGGRNVSSITSDYQELQFPRTSASNSAVDQRRTRS